MESITSTKSFLSCNRVRVRNYPYYHRRPLHQDNLLKVKVWSTLGFSTIKLSKKSQIHAISNGKGESSSMQHDTDKEEGTMVLRIVAKRWRKLQVYVATGLVVCTFMMMVPSADAVDALKTCVCLLNECRLELTKCIADPSCAANIACLQTCNDRPDETECQIKCGDLFENKVVDQFNECAVSRKKCVPQKSDLGEFPIPDPSTIVKNFNISDFTGNWYITSGLNPTFDTFDCQLHRFEVEGNQLVGNLTWRIPTPDTGFFTRSAVQKFKQDPSNPGILYNHDNEFLHYQDDWYILSSKIENKPDDYVFVYYRGRNDAWDGYGGAFIYTKSAELPESIVPELERSAKSIGRDFGKFITTNNSCGPEPPLVERIEKTVEEGENFIAKEVEEGENFIAKEVEEGEKFIGKEVEEGEKLIEKEVEDIESEVLVLEKAEESLLERLAEGVNGIKRDFRNLLAGLNKEEMEVLSELKLEAAEVEKIFGQALPIRKLR